MKFTRVFAILFFLSSNLWIVCYCDVYQCWHEFLHDFMRSTHCRAKTNNPISLAKNKQTHKTESFIFFCFIRYLTNIFIRPRIQQFIAIFLPICTKNSYAIWTNVFTAINWRPRSSHRFFWDSFFSPLFLFFSFVTVLCMLLLLLVVMVYFCSCRFLLAPFRFNKRNAISWTFRLSLVSDCWFELKF